ncbi:MAG: hypothetical protein K0S54_2615 [Alphaproteobacteria bacterium]|nr:hypothetical protein [Alphaproteobacteria bacterium]
MSETSSSPASDGGFSASEASDGDSALVQFGGDTPAVSLFSEAPQTEWALAANEAGLEGAALDTLSSPDVESPAPAVAAITFLIAEAQPFIESDDMLVGMLTPGENVDPAASDDAMVGWTSEEPDAIGTTHAYAPETSYVIPHDVIAHGISLDWTDTLLSYS